MNGVISLADGRVVRWSLWSEELCCCCAYQALFFGWANDKKYAVF